MKQISALVVLPIVHTCSNPQSQGGNLSRSKILQYDRYAVNRTQVQMSVTADCSSVRKLRTP